MKKLLFTVVTFLVAGSSQAQQQQMSREQMQQVRALCEADIRRICPGVRPGGGRLMACIQEKPEQLSAPCAEALLDARAGRKP